MSNTTGTRRFLGVLPCVIALLCASSGPASASSYVFTSPIPGSLVAPPHAQIVFRGIPASRIGSVSVVGSRSGNHGGSIRADSDGNGGSFVPAHAFTSNEVVTVRTHLNIYGGRNGEFSFRVATPAGYLSSQHWPTAGRNRGDVWTFHSRRDLKPASVHFSHPGHAAPGDVFLSPQFGPLQDGPEIVDQHGNLVWFKPLHGDTSGSVFRVQRYRGRPVLTWWQGYVAAGVGIGDDIINNTAYRQIAVVRAHDGMAADLHSFVISPQNTALITAVFPVWWNASSVGGSKRQLTYDSVVQEVDIPTGLLLFQWDSLDHVSLSDSYTAPPRSGNHSFDPFHVNAISVARNGNLLISGRHTWAGYDVSRRTGHVFWAVGGKHSYFNLGSGAQFAFQHDIRMGSDDSYITMFDNGAGPSQAHSQSRGLRLSLDYTHKTSNVSAQFEHSPSILATYEGSYQQLPNGNVFIGWGDIRYFTEYNSGGQVVEDGHFADGDPSFVAEKHEWTGTPHTRPAIAASNSGSSTLVYASWNGDNRTVRWRVLGGSSAGSLHTITTVSKGDFETGVRIGRQSYVAVQALDGSGHVLAASSTVRS